jgi:hypothetical protein
MEGAEAPNVEWRIIAGFDKYDVSNTGLVRNRLTNRILKTSIQQNGYCSISLSLNGVATTHYIHQVVATAFIGDSEGREIDHIDHRRDNNIVANLRYVTKSENQKSKASSRGVAFEYVDNLPEEAIVVEEYGNHRFENLFYVPGAAEFYYFNGVQYKRLHRNVRALDGGISVMAWNTQGQNVRLALAKYRRLINDMP